MSELEVLQMLELAYMYKQKIVLFKDSSVRIDTSIGFRKALEDIPMSEDVKYKITRALELSAYSNGYHILYENYGWGEGMKYARLETIRQTINHFKNKSTYGKRNTH